MNRTEFFKKVRELVDSSESNFKHGRPEIGRKKLDAVNDLIFDYREGSP